jgi:hypothetical protein
MVSSAGHLQGQTFHQNGSSQELTAHVALVALEATGLERCHVPGWGLSGGRSDCGVELSPNKGRSG